METTTLHIEITDELRMRLLTAAQDIIDESARAFVFVILGSVDEVSVDLADADLDPIIRGPAQHIAHQINH